MLQHRSLTPCKRIYCQRESPLPLRERGIIIKSILTLIRLYQLFIFPLIGPCCRFEPSCSRYAQEVFTMYGFWRGMWLTVRRLCRCHPWGSSGYDPVPPHQP